MGPYSNLECEKYLKEYRGFLAILEMMTGFYWTGFTMIFDLYEFKRIDGSQNSLGSNNMEENN